MDQRKTVRWAAPNMNSNPWTANVWKRLVFASGFWMMQQKLGGRSPSLAAVPGLWFNSRAPCHSTPDLESDSGGTIRPDASNRSVLSVRIRSRPSSEIPVRTPEISPVSVSRSIRMPIPHADSAHAAHTRSGAAASHFRRRSVSTARTACGVGTGMEGDKAPARHPAGQRVGPSGAAARLMPIPTSKASGRFSSSSPATLRPSSSTSFGHFSRRRCGAASSGLKVAGGRNPPSASRTARAVANPASGTASVRRGSA